MQKKRAEMAPNGEALAIWSGPGRQSATRRPRSGTTSPRLIRCTNWLVSAKRTRMTAPMDNPEHQEYRDPGAPEKNQTR